jgi:hypothetical protein
MGEGCGTRGGEETYIQVFARKPEGKRLLGRPRQDERIILKWILKK